MFNSKVIRACTPVVVVNWNELESIVLLFHFDCGMNLHAKSCCEIGMVDYTVVRKSK